MKATGEMPGMCTCLTLHAPTMWSSCSRIETSGCGAVATKTLAARRRSSSVIERMSGTSMLPPFSRPCSPMEPSRLGGGDETDGDERDLDRKPKRLLQDAISDDDEDRGDHEGGQPRVQGK